LGPGTVHSLRTEFVYGGAQVLEKLEVEGF